jgi:N-acetylglucosaminyl-diphospho-decaprenol L-rhamnosyltransferase
MDPCSVIIVNYNTGELLKQSVDAALSSTSIKELIVVDNNSSDESMGLLQDDQRLKKLYREKNYGFAASCNYAAQVAKTDVLIFLNPDCIIQSSTIGDLLTTLGNNEKAAIMGCLVNNPDGTEQRASRRRLPTLWRAIKTFTHIEKLAGFCHCFAGVNLNHQTMVNTVTKVEAISGAFIMMKTHVFDEIAGFDEKFPLHFEDLDLFKRTGNAGYDILFDPQVSVTHYQGTSSKSNPKVAEFKRIGRQRYFKKHGSNFSNLVMKLLSKIV